MSTRIRVTLVTAGFLSLLTLTFVGIWLAQQGRYLRAEQLRRSRVATDLIAVISQDALAEGQVLRLARIADRAVLDEDISRVLIADRTGVVLVDSSHTAYGTRPQIIRRALQSRRIIIEPGSDRWTGASPVVNEQNQTLGGVMAEFPTEALLAAQSNTRGVAILLALLGILVGSALAYFAARLITRPLERLLAGIRQVQAGEVAEPVPVSGGPELSQIGDAFNLMADVVRNREHQLQALNRMATRLPLASDLQQMAHIINESTAAMMEARAYIWVVDQFSRLLNPVPSGAEPASDEPISASCDCAAAVAFAQRRILVIGKRDSDLPPGSLIAEGLHAISAIVLPLITHDGVAGVMAIVEPGGMKWITPEDEVLAKAVSTITAPLIMARLRAEAQARAASALQALLIPAELPDIGIDIHAVYAPAEEIAGLGGDYYDLIPLGGPRWAVAVGDTSGKGLEAARYTATAKYVLRSYVLEYSSPAQALNWSNRAMGAQEELGRFITVFCGVLDVSVGSMVYANAGHMPPLIYRHATGQVTVLSGGGLALGIAPDLEYVDTELTLGHGDIMCIYTDGLPEARRGDEWFGDARLAEAVVESAGLPSADICDHVMRSVRDFSGNHLRDDVVLMVLKMP